MHWDQDKRGDGGVLTLQPEGEAGTFEDYLIDLDECLQCLAPLREMLMSGDLLPVGRTGRGAVADHDGDSRRAGDGGVAGGGGRNDVWELLRNARLRSPGSGT